MLFQVIVSQCLSPQACPHILAVLRPSPHPDCTNMKILGDRCYIFCSYFKILAVIQTTQNAQRRSDQNLETCVAGHLEEQSNKSWVVSTPLASYVLVLG
jgi:hypothetical protein